MAPSVSIVVVAILAVVGWRLMFQRNAAFDASNGEAWYTLGMATNMSGHAVVNGSNHSKLECFVQSLSRPDNGHHALAWVALAKTLGPKETASVNGTKVNKKAAFLEAVRSDKSLFRSWFDLGTIMSASETVSVHGEAVNKSRAFAFALGVNATHEPSWFFLGMELGQHDEIQIAHPVTGDVREVVTKALCFVRALEIDPTLATWGSLGSALAPTQRITVLGEEVGRKECFVHVLNMDAMHAIGWLNLGSSLAPGDTATIGNETYTQRDCFVMCLRRNSKIAGAWFNLGMVMAPGDSVQVVPGVDESFIKDRAEAFARAVTMNPKASPIWYALAEAIPSSSETVTLFGKPRTKADCYAKAAGIDAKNRTFWEKLAVELEQAAGSGKATVADVVVTAVDCRAKAAELPQ